MAYYLKKTYRKNDCYLQIYFSFRDKEKKQTSQKSIRALGYVNKLKELGIEDPFIYGQEIVDKMNIEAKKARKEETERKITRESPERNIGYFTLHDMFHSLDPKNYLDILVQNKKYQFDFVKLLEALIYARVISPCSKKKTLEEVIPLLYYQYDFSLDQVYDGLEFMGSEYECIIEIFNKTIWDKYRRNTEKLYFDCTNFFFEIDKEDSIRRKGPSKENRHEPIISMGLLLDSEQIPIGMKMFPGNESEKPVIRDIIKDLKERYDVVGRTVQVADKGLNCSENIVAAVRDGDGFIYSQSCKILSEKEKLWLLRDNDYSPVNDSNGELVYKIKSCIDTFEYKYTDESGTTKTVKLKQLRVATWNKALYEKKLYEINKMSEKAKALSASKAKKSEFGDCAKYISFNGVDVDGVITEKVIASFNQEVVDNDIRLAGYNLLITSEHDMSASQVYDIYHNLWRIEESFRIMKTQLDARPVYLQKKNTIVGHFLICYLSVLLLRLLQFKVFQNSISADELTSFIRAFRCAYGENNIINLMTLNNTVDIIEKRTKLSITSYFLSEIKIDKLFAHRF